MGATSCKMKRANPSPYRRRVTLVEEVQRLLKEKDDDVPRKLMELRKACGMDLQQSDDSLIFPLDNTLVALILDLTMTINVRRPAVWEAEVKELCYRIKRHLLPPKCPGRMPGPENIELTELCLTNIPLHKKNRLLSAIDHLIRNNEGLTRIELAYTGLSNADLSRHVLQPASTLRQLTYLGLKGNHLSKRIIDSILQLMDENGKFPSIHWIDLRNNVDIFALPLSFLEALQERYPIESEPDVQQLAHGEVLIAGDIKPLTV